MIQVKIKGLKEVENALKDIERRFKRLDGKKIFAKSEPEALRKLDKELKRL